MTDLDIVRSRLVTQRLAGEPAADPAEAVRWLGAVQAQEFAEAKWSLAERTHNATDATVETAFAEGDIIRTHLLRPTWHFVARDDVRWLLRLTRPRVHALNRYWYSKVGLTAEDFTRGHAALARALDDGRPRTRTEVAEHLGTAGVDATGMRLALLLMHAELEEVICSGPRRGKQHTYALLDHRVPTHALDGRPREAAVTELVLRYFRSHGPATVNDFTHWSSLTVADTRTALDRLGDQLEVQTRDGTPWYASPPSSTEHPAPGAREGTRTAGGAYLIPMYDETIVAYQDLRVVLAHPAPRPDLLERAIVIDGRTHGTWKRRLTARTVTVEATLFADLTTPQRAALDAAVHRFGDSLGLEAHLTLHR